MIYQLLGPDGFRQGMDLYFKKFDGMAVTIEDFLDVMAEVSDRNLDQFHRWYTQSGTPRVNMVRTYDAAARTMTLTFTQSTRPDRNQKKKRPLHIPVKLGFIDSQGEPVGDQQLIELTQERESLVFEDMPGDALPSVFREFSAPVRLTTDFKDEELTGLMANDKDEFNQWDAAQTLFIKEIKQLVSAVQTENELTISPDLVHAFSAALTNTQKDRAFLAKTLTLPLETEVKDHYDIIDVPAIHKARQWLKQKIAGRLKPEFLDLFRRCNQSDPRDISSQAMADRSLKNLCLSYLGSLDDQESKALVQNQFETALNMTDEFNAFRLLTRMDQQTRDRSCKTFYAKWKDQALVLDKWFAVQAVSPLADTLDQVKALTAHQEFSMTNPNKVRSLIYTFALQNPVHFHRPDGLGYEFIAERILALDRINHQIAARLASCFNLWKRYDDHQRPLMKKALETIIDSSDLSKNLYEIVSRAIE